VDNTYFDFMASDSETLREPSDSPLSFRTKLAYGAGDVGPAITAMILLSYLSPFLTDVAGLEPGKAGLSQLVGKIWDAVNDPIVGVMSDRGNVFGEKIRQRWGRRYPWMMVGAIPLGIFFFLQWIVPFDRGNQWGLFFFYTLISILFNSFYTVVNLPYTALTAELTPDYDERTSLSTFRFMFSIGGSIVSLLIARAVFMLSIPADQQYLWMGLVCGLIAILPVFWTVFGTRHRMSLASQAAPEESLPVFSQLRSVFANRPFLYVVGIYLCSWLSLQVTAAIIPYFVVNWMGLKADKSPLVMLAVQGTAFAMLPLWGMVSKKLGKKVAYFMGSSLWIVAQGGLFLLQPGQEMAMYGLAILAGAGVSTAYLIPWSMLPDVIELDELQTGQRREGIFYSLMVFLQKVCLGFAVALVLQSLEWTGYQPPIAGVVQEQLPAVLTAMRWAIGPLPTLCLLAGLVLAYFYPITKERHQQTLLALAERRSSQDNP
jgi:glycoside/pentoside/hexuronide:cation symporter, GPH family